ncbi:BAR-domain-containing protein [Phaeosphaeriaceae sp. SRC1lsM3a]|nr:BAR-domain-containing protein [Stagonospora sp. SRC1lsM3a]
MNINKKFDRFKQWTNERLGAEARTGLSEDFKALEMEMNLRHEGLDKMHKSMATYVKSLSKRAEGDDREKQIPGGHLGSTMVTHGEDFEPDSEFGNCLSSLGRANERLARLQETYVATATTSWLEGLERSLVQMKEYQAARKKLETRRLAYDTSLAKMQKTKKEDFRMEEELRAQKAKYEETSEDVFRRMQDIKEAEVELVQDLNSFLEAELSYHDRCREVLLNVKREWPVRSTATTTRPARSRSINTAHGYADRFNPVEEEPEPEAPRMTIPKLSSRNRSPEASSPGGYPLRPSYSRTSTYDSTTNGTRDDSPARRLTRVPTDSSVISASRGSLRPVRQANAFADEYDDDYGNSNGHRRDRSPPSPDRSSQGSSSVMSRAASWSAADLGTNGKKAPPPPPPSRAKKPPPPPPPMKRSALSASELARY